MFSIIKQIFSSSAPPPPNYTQALQAAPKVKSDVTEVLPKEEKEEKTEIRRHLKLIMVTAANNNKFYEMKENSDGTFTAFYGRVGGHSSSATYPISQWDKKRREKVRKGYTDQTELFAEKSSVEDFAVIPDEKVRNLIGDLLNFSRQSILRNYNVAADQVTRKQVEKAQAILDRLVKKAKPRLHLDKFNQELIELYTIIPRRMSKVADHLIERPKSTEDIQNIKKKLAEEQATLDVMRGEVEALEQQKQPGEKRTLTHALGIQVEPLSDPKLIQCIKKMMGKDSGKFHRAFKVTNARTQKAFDDYVEKCENKKTALFWHGSRNENWLSILKMGLVLRPANAIITGKMFGYGLYFADKFRKSLNYSSLWGSYWSGGRSNKAYLALYDVHLGQSLKIKRHQGWCSQLTADKLKKKGEKYSSVFAQGGADLINNEYIVYHQSQCTVRYLVEIIS